MSSEEKILEVEHLFVTLDSRHFPRDISFSLSKGEALAIVGPNGAGKTVLFRALLGSVPYKFSRSLDSFDRGGNLAARRQMHVWPGSCDKLGGGQRCRRSLKRRKGWQSELEPLS